MFAQDGYLNWRLRSKHIFFFFFWGGGGGEGLQPFETVFQSISNCMPGTGRPLSVSHDF